MTNEVDRRQFLARGFSALGATWAAAHWPAIVAAAEHARKAAASPDSQKFEFLTPEEAQEVEAIASCIIPSDGTPGAREAGVVFFIDRALVTFSVDDQKTYRQGLPEIQNRLKELFPAATVFSAATADEQRAVLESLDEAESKDVPGRRRGGPGARSLFELLRAHTIQGFLIDPDADRRGNRGGVGWTTLGRDLQHSFQPPFGYYDRGYAGWQPNTAGPPEKK